MESPGIARRLAKAWLKLGYKLTQTIMVTGELSIIDGFLMSRRNYERVSCFNSISLVDTRFLKYMDNFQAVAVSRVISFKPHRQIFGDPIAHLSQLALNGRVRDNNLDANADDMAELVKHEEYYGGQFQTKAAYDLMEKRRSKTAHHQYTFQVHCDPRGGDEALRVLVFEIAAFETNPSAITAGVLTWTESDGLAEVCRENFWQGLKQMSLLSSWKT